MFKHTLVSLAVALTAFSGIPTNASAQQSQSAAHAESSVRAADAAYTTQLAARSATTGGDVDHVTGAKAAVPAGNAPAGRSIAPELQCVGPVSFCNPYFGS
ncbi:hypothetical protein [Burkholderia pseudomallei]|uniref:hypothetical protein n=1 Tax=Burkholderia pseudomallei TaxID=28450 RepID=UPI00052A9E7F|nr:hypothetical protein [Burkholderia pseudomallei]AIV54268.1 hypothetical protein Y603_5036 [Burkholderia pseudomallei MSHR1153]KGS53185.1 hypothetical protein X949_5848 [Burkholderia pseudomallei MSHR5609]KGX50670.1 hypothetical protein Y024_5871 [Burkholderia pseudomallei TSV44]CAJ9668794.1 Uncharacterised protein [Burkholderia pseudomallei]